MGEKFFSHYDKNLQQGKLIHHHLHEVETAAQQSVPPFLHFDVLDADQVKEYAALTARFHDLGKYTSFFQEYLLNGKDSIYRSHAHISAWLLFRYLKTQGGKNIRHEKNGEVLFYLLYIIVRRHHSDLTLDRLFDTADIPKLEKELSAQLQDLRNKSQILKEQLDLDTRLMVQASEETRLLNDPSLILGHQRIRKQNNRHERWYFLLIYLFSQLVDKDKFSAAELQFRPVKLVQPDRVVEYISEKQKDAASNVGDDRDLARRTIIRQLEKLSEEGLKQVKIFTLTAPTGLGKTLSALQAALVIGERLREIYGYSPRIITAIPFINIIEQTKEDYLQVLRDCGTLNIHHRLSEKRLKDSAATGEEQPLEKVLLEVESWEGDVILTTFVQFFQSLFTGRNAALKKVNKLAGSIVILDEIQSIPEHYMALIGAAIIRMSEYYGTRFILMSATQPHVLELGKKLLEKHKNPNESLTVSPPVELLPDYEKYYKKLQRTRIIPVLASALNTDQFIDFFQETWDNRSAVIIVNTINRCIEIYKKIKKVLPEGVKVFHLSTNLIPVERKRVIKEVKEALIHHKVVLVSTQTIEAGVDLDFEVGYRDIAPLESLIQSAGRINRNNLHENALCPLYVVQLERDFTWIYPLHQMEKTKTLLLKYKEIPEYEYLTVVNDYYAHLAQHLPTQSEEIWAKGIQKLDFEVISKFRMIEDDAGVVEVFVELDERAKQLADIYQMFRQNNYTELKYVFESLTGEKLTINEDGEITTYQRKALLGLILGQMSEYMVQIRYSRFLKTKPLEFSVRGGIESTFFWVPHEQLHDFYDKEIGYGEVEDARIW